MPAKLATESQWKACATKNRIKDNGLQKALAEYEKLGDEKSAEKVKALDAVKKLVTGLTKDKTVSANADVAKFLDGLEAGVGPAKKEVEAAAKADEAKLSDIRAIASEVGKVLGSTKDQLAGIAKDGGGPCGRLLDRVLAAGDRAQLAARAIGSGNNVFRDLDAYWAALEEYIDGQEALQNCLRANELSGAVLGSFAGRLSGLKSRLDRARAQLTQTGR